MAKSKSYIGVTTDINRPTGKWKYGSMVLPALPEGDHTTYPYSYISYSAIEGYKFRVFTKPLVYVLSNGKCTPSANATYVECTVWNKSDDAWGSWSSVKTATANSTYVTTPMWCNTEIPYSDGSQILLRWTEPVPQYEDVTIDAARLIKKIYVGVPTAVDDNTVDVARKVVKGYIGDENGIARLIFGRGELVYHGTVTPLYYRRMDLAAAKAGNHALFAGGHATVTDNSNEVCPMVEAYDELFTVSYLDILSQARATLSGISVGEYALFGGGESNSSLYYADVDAYSSSLTHTNADPLQEGVIDACVANAGKYALFVGGGGLNYTRLKKATAYNESLTKCVAPDLMYNYHPEDGTTFDGKAVFCGNYDGAYVYDGSLTHSFMDIDFKVYSSHTSIVGGNHLFYNAGKEHTEVVNKSFTRFALITNSAMRKYSAGVSMNDYAIFAGGFYGDNTPSDVVEAFDSSLTMTIQHSLSVAKCEVAAVVVGDYAFFGGGITAKDWTAAVLPKDASATVDVYKII